jgi:hypothetical protein
MRWEDIVHSTSDFWLESFKIYSRIAAYLSEPIHKFSKSVEKPFDVYVINRVITFMIQFRCPLSMMTSSDKRGNEVQITDMAQEG